MEKIVDKDVVYALVIRASEPFTGVNFMTPDDYSLQLAVSVYAEGAECVPHIHLDCPRSLLKSGEVIFVQQGSVEIDVYTDSAAKIATLTLGSGDVIYFVQGGHALRFNSETRILEVKQGPYLGKTADKKLLEL